MLGPAAQSRIRMTMVGIRLNSQKAVINNWPPKQTQSKGAMPMLTPNAAIQNRANRLAMYNGNALKIGLFGANCSSGRSATKVPERWSASWLDCLRLARMADEAGLQLI